MPSFVDTIILVDDVRILAELNFFFWDDAEIDLRRERIELKPPGMFGSES